MRLGLDSVHRSQICRGSSARGSLSASARRIAPLLLGHPVRVENGAEARDDVLAGAQQQQRQVAVRDGGGLGGA